MGELLWAWRASKARGEAKDARRYCLDEMGELLQQAYDAKWALWALMNGPDNALNLNAVDLDEFAEVQAADHFYEILRAMVEGAGLHVRPYPEAPARRGEETERHRVEERAA